MAPPQVQISEPRFEPCAATASLFLYAQGSKILCLHHDTLAVERRFTSHSDDIDFISVDNVSERGAGRLVVSYDVGQTAIVWDIFTGTEISRFASFEHLRVASWMRNGNVAFGNGKGEVIMFEPSTSEHISARTIFDPITSLAPAQDCRTYAIGYQNGSILIATLLPQFTILHTLTTSRGPSSIITIAWHASSSKQKSDMLATQASNGDLRVWSVSKPAGKEPPRVTRELKRSDSTSADPKWMAWSKNGRIVQFLEGETWSWDVRTKHVTCEPIPTIDGVRGLANHGPTATLFTIGPNNTVQQYDVDNPSMVANVQHIPSSSRSLISEEGRRTSSPRRLQDAPDIRESSRRRTPFDSSTVDSVKQARADLISPASSRSRTESVSSKASSGRYKVAPFSPPSRSGQSGTTFSLTSGDRDTPQPSAGFPYASSVSMSSVKSSRAGSRLRNEVQMSPAEKNIVDLFPFIRARLNDVPYKSQPPFDESNLTPEDLRQQMLSMVFGWDGDIQDLIRDELSRHAPGSQSAILLAQWLGENDSDQMASLVGGGPPTAYDWMLLALSQMSGQAQANKVGQAFVQKTLEIGDVHTAATILLGLGDSNDAIEVYVSRNHFMEAILMTCLLMPSDWQRQSYLVRRWGEFVVSHSQQQLAIRCFMCTGAEPSEPWTSPAAQQAASFAEVIRGKSPLASPDPMHQINPHLMPPQARPSSASNQRPAGRTPSLKLITSFDGHSNQKYRFPGLKSDDRTPTNAPGVTPIAESAVADSAISPGGLGSWKLNNIQSLNQAMTSRTNTPAFNRRRLPSIGETPVDSQPPTFSRSGSYNNTSAYGSTSENEDTSGHEQSQDEREVGPLLSAAAYAPSNDSLKPSPQTAVQATDQFASLKGLPSPAAGFYEALKDHSDIRNGSRVKKPDGLQIDLVETEEAPLTKDDRPDLIPSAKSMNSYASTKSPSVSGRSIDQYISSLDEASFRSRKHHGRRTHGRSRRNTDEHDSQSSRVHHSRDVSQETTRGRNERRYIQPSKRSPSSPVPMSPDEVARYHAGESAKQDAAKLEAPRTKSRNRTRSSSKMRKPGSRSRHRSSSRHTANRVALDSRGRSVDREGSFARSPSSPLPMTLPMTLPDHEPTSESAEDPLRLVAENRERLRSKPRSASRRRASSRAGKETGSRRGGSPESKHKVSHSQPVIRPPPDLEFPTPQPEVLEQLSSKVFGQDDVLSSKAFDQEEQLSSKAFGDEPQLSSKAFGQDEQLHSKAFGEDPELQLSSKTFGQDELSNGTFGQEVQLSSRAFGDEEQLSSKAFGQEPQLSSKTFGQDNQLSSKAFGQEEQLSSKAFGHEDVLSNRTFQDDVFESGRKYGSRPNSTANDAHDEVSPTTPFVSFAEKKRRELAAAELEARRLSLARNPSAPNIPFPSDLQSGRSPIESPAMHGGSYFPRIPSRNMIPPAKTSPEYPSSSDSGSSRSGRSGPPLGLPATPRAMRHPKYGDRVRVDERPPSVPAISSDRYGSNNFLDSRNQEVAERIGRSMSVPMPEGQIHHRNPPAQMPDGLPMHPHYKPNLPRSRSNSRARNMGHRRTSSGGYISPSVSVSIEETIENAMQRRPSAPQVEAIPPPPPPPPILPELQHLNTPPPPPPIPMLADATSPRQSSATIDVAFDNEDMGRLLPRAMTAAPTIHVNVPDTGKSGGKRSSFEHRRNRSSNESFTNKLRSLTRMRGNSRSVEPWGGPDPDAQYETLGSGAYNPPGHM